MTRCETADEVVAPVLTGNEKISIVAVLVLLFSYLSSNRLSESIAALTTYEPLAVIPKSAYGAETKTSPPAILCPSIIEYERVVLLLVTCKRASGGGNATKLVDVWNVQTT